MFFIKKKLSKKSIEKKLKQNYQKKKKKNYIKKKNVLSKKKLLFHCFFQNIFKFIMLIFKLFANF